MVHTGGGVATPGSGPGAGAGAKQHPRYWIRSYFVSRSLRSRGRARDTYRAPGTGFQRRPGQAEPSGPTAAPGSERHPGCRKP